MINILAQTNGTLMVLGGAGGGALLTGIIYKIANRQLNKVLDHVDNNDIHISDKNGYVTTERGNHWEKELLCLRKETRDDIKGIHIRIDEILVRISELKQ